MRDSGIYFINLGLFCKINSITSATKAPTIGTKLILPTINPNIARRIVTPTVAPNPHAIPPVKLFTNISFLLLLILSCGSAIKLLYYKPSCGAISFIEARTISMNLSKGTLSFSSQAIIDARSAPLANDLS